MGGSKQPAVTTQINKTELPPWVDAAAQQNLAEANRIAQKPYVQYPGERVAGMTDLEAAAGGTLQSGIDFTQAALGLGAGAANQAIGFQAGQINGPAGVANVNAQGFTDRDISAYMDPNINNVVDTTLGGMRQNLTRSAQAQADAARGAGAWGGSRFGVEQAVLQSEGARQMAATEAGLRSQAYSDAAGRLQQDNATNLQAQLANQQSGLTTQGQQLTADQANLQAQLAAAGINLQGGQLAGQLGQSASDTMGKNATLQQLLGQNERGINQAQLDTDYQNWYDAQNHDLNNLNLKMTALGLTPYGKTTTTESTQQNNNSSNGWMTALGGIATLGSLFFSDPKTKKNIKSKGKVPGTDLNKYEFEYKKGMGIGGKQVGLMSTDVKKKVPEAVVPVQLGGKKVDAVDYEMALAKATKPPRADKGKKRAPYKMRVGIGSRMAA